MKRTVPGERQFISCESIPIGAGQSLTQIGFSERGDGVRRDKGGVGFGVGALCLSLVEVSERPTRTGTRPPIPIPHHRIPRPHPLSLRTPQNLLVTVSMLPTTDLSANRKEE